MYRNFFDFVMKQWINHGEFKDLYIQIHSWTFKAAWLSLLYWIDNVGSKVALKMNHVLSDMIQKAKPGPPEVAMYFGALKASNSSRSNVFLGAQVTNDDTEILHEGLMFLVSLILEPPKGDPEDENSILTEVDARVKEAASLISSYCFGEVKGNIAKENSVLISDFLEKVEMIKAKVRQFHVQIPDSSFLDFPKTNGLGFIDFLLRNLEEKLKYESLPIPKHQILAVREGFMFMQPIVKDISQPQNECLEIKDLWKRIVNVAYQAEHVIDSFSIGDSTFLCNMEYLSNIIEEIASITTKVKEIKDKRMFNIGVVTDEMNYGQNLITEANSTSQTHEDFVGFKDEEQAIIDRLTSDSMELDIVSIVGMPGLGKTTLAKKIHDSPLIQNQFRKSAWCSVSQFYKRRELLSTIFKAVGTFVGEIQKQSEEDLEYLLYKSLKGQRYLIVMDDIWDIDAWKELQKSFPNDRNGSRIMLTTRILDVALQANPNSPHFLRSFSDEECWELLRKKLFHADDCLPNFLDVGMQIAKKCKGLPLAVVVIAGILAKEAKNLRWWRQIEESLGSHIASTSCMNILELSYNHLPNFLKPCFLYLRAFQEDRRIDAKMLTLLWTAEGFILNPGSKSLKEVAQEYLMDLINRNLVLVSRKSSTGGIKYCYMHDLILELCLKKAKEEHFMELVREDGIKAKPSASRSNPTRYDQYRLSIHSDPSSFIDLSATGPCVRSIIFPFSFEDFRFGDLNNFCDNFKFLKVLHLWSHFGGLEKEWKSFPIELTSLVHLRYLAIMCRSIASISPSIANLKNLETFLVGNQVPKSIKLPNTMWKMRRLSYVKIDNASISSYDDVFEESYQLDHIDSFSSIILEHEGDAEKLLRRIPSVRKLKFKIFESWDNQFSVLGSLSKLEALSLENLTSTYTYEISFPSSLKKLYLWGLHRPWKEISAIGKLPNLEGLKLSDHAFEGQRWDMEDEEFLNLKCLKLYFLDFRQWNASFDPFPCLQQLYVESCFNLEEIPYSFGAISTLNMIQVLDCTDDATRSARQIVEDQQDLGNKELEVDIRKSYWG